MNLHHRCKFYRQMWANRPTLRLRHTVTEVQWWGKRLFFLLFLHLTVKTEQEYNTWKRWLKMAHTVYCSASHNRIREWCRRQTRTSQNILLSRNSNKLIISWTTGTQQKDDRTFHWKKKKKITRVNNKSLSPVKVLWIEQVGKSTQLHRVMIGTERRSDSER